MPLPGFPLELARHYRNAKTPQQRKAYAELIAAFYQADNRQYLADSWLKCADAWSQNDEPKREGHRWTR